MKWWLQPLGTLGSVASSLISSLYQWNHGLYYNWEMYTPYTCADGMLLHMNKKNLMEEFK
jgi:hypothetical protein